MSPACKHDPIPACGLHGPWRLPWAPLQVNPIYKHTSEDPSVFIDHRGHWHMLINALPGGCNPKLQQGGY